MVLLDAAWLALQSVAQDIDRPSVTVPLEESGVGIPFGIVEQGPAVVLTPYQRIRIGERFGPKEGFAEPHTGHDGRAVE